MSVERLNQDTLILFPQSSLIFSKANYCLLLSCSIAGHRSCDSTIGEVHMILDFLWSKLGLTFKRI